MSSLTRAIRDDIIEYIRLCKKYHEMMQHLEDGVPDCYGIHARMLKKQEMKDEDDH